MLSPILHELAEEKSGALKVGKINVERADGAGNAFSGIQHSDAGRFQGRKSRRQVGGLSA